MPRGCGEDVPQWGTLPAECALKGARVSKRSSGRPGRKALHSPTCWTRPPKGKESRGSKRVTETLMLKQRASLHDNRKAATSGRRCDLWGGRLRSEAGGHGATAPVPSGGAASVCRAACRAQHGVCSAAPSLTPGAHGR